MINIILIIQMFFNIVIGIYFLNALKKQQSNKIIIDKESKKEMEKLNKLRKIKLTEPLSEKSRPTSFKEVIGQNKGIKTLKAALCSPNPQHVIIYGPPGVGKTAAARLILEEAKKQKNCPFNKNSKFIEIDATTVRFDERGIADPLIGSVHDPIYQGAGKFGKAGIPQPKPGAVTKAHGGILFIDEIGELHPNEMNRLLKVLEDRKVFLDSSYYSSSDNNMPLYIKEIFEKGLPADFRLVGATTKGPEEIPSALRSRCMEVFFRALTPEEIRKIVKNSCKKINYKIDDKACNMIVRYCDSGREAINLVQIASGIALNEHRDYILLEDVELVIENGQYSLKLDKKVGKKPKIGYVNGLAVNGINVGTIMEIEAIAIKTSVKKELKVTGIIEEEELNSQNRKLKRKSTAICSIENVITVLEKKFNIDFNNYNIHVNFPGGIPVDGPSAGISIATAIYSAITGLYVDNSTVMTGELSLHGEVKPIGGINAKIQAGIRGGAKKIIIPMENWSNKFSCIKEAKVIPVSNIDEVIKQSLMIDNINNNLNDIKLNADILSAESLNIN
ncbi:Lon protease 2 [Clostridium acetireducens DSM 10703]|jgi:Lon-like ATP-dependent protease|uniref:endopeptidase La n=1 Tax=Clostridium acetireducens DSM 10703 TaxID=1121290 RepID=A0A1E8EV20_9CLOT|nr:ATP-dependent protease LonB [Clostridium acetireducens]OFH98083.1 Lon protease 2 [Clostridium acetireducens DSM 10703]